MSCVLQAGNARFASSAGIVALAASTLAISLPSAASAQSAQTAPPPAPGSMIVLRDVPTRPAQATGTGETLEVQTAPQFAFGDAVELGINELDDATAALITSSTINGFAQLSRVDAGSNAVDALIGDTLSQNNLAILDGGTSSSAGSIVSGSIGASIDAANASIGSALGSLNGALGGFNSNGSNGGG